MDKAKYKILAIYRPHIVWRLLDILLTILLILPVLFVGWLHTRTAIDIKFLAVVGGWPLGVAMMLLIHAFTFRMIVTSEGIILQTFGQREVPYDLMEAFDWQLSHYSRRHRLPTLGIRLSEEIKPRFPGISKLFFFGALSLNNDFFVLEYVPIPRHFGLLRRDIHFEKFKATEFGQILYQHAPQLFPENEEGLAR